MSSDTGRQWSHVTPPFIHPTYAPWIPASLHHSLAEERVLRCIEYCELFLHKLTFLPGVLLFSSGMFRLCSVPCHFSSPGFIPPTLCTLISSDCTRTDQY
jgi:hypothetical protein